MTNKLRWKIVIVSLLVFLISIFAWYPPLADWYGLNDPDFVLQKRLRLGLDLKGGVHLVLRVNTDDAVRLETRAIADRLREELVRQAVRTGPIETLNDRQFRVSGVDTEQHQQFRRAGDEVAGNFSRESMNEDVYVFTMSPNAVASLREYAVMQARQTVDRRVNELGVAEPLIAVQGADRDEILVQLPGVTDLVRAREIIRSTALLEWKLVESGPAPTPETLLNATGGVVPPNTEVVTAVQEVPATKGSTAYYLVRSAAIVTGSDLRTARPMRDENNQPAVGFSLTRDGARKFSQLTRDNIGRHLAIVLDGRVQSAPQIETQISGGEGYIRGSFTQQEAADLSLVLRTGALRASMTYLGGRYVGPSLGTDSIRAGIVASIMGLGLVAVFMLVYYKRAGINAVASVAVNLLVLLGFMAYLGAVLTLPGIAGLILTIGMGVDSNVLIFERIKEELGTAKSPKAAVRAGFDRVFLTILDTHIASLIAAAFLFQFGTGPIRGFATTLTFGLLSNVFTAVFVSRMLFELSLARRQGTPARVPRWGPRQAGPLSI